ncbi:leukotriene A-4 hydrolase-like [Sinocyclocheilus grahami]|uniref:leukotriene A-4 hydrolase-like n=1 Tax=Sinocyclocheilus grahami TaxID=75366 RepID=UPI0007ACA683|nr:PREDICTED: leukotriene A-4 hydrolase-like [Sinocyclocheilus grahami]
MTPVSDPSSFSSVSKCATKHLNLIYHVEFDRRVLKGKVALTVEVLEDKLSSLTLDSKDLKIFKVSANGQAAQFALGTKHTFKGSPLEITLPFELSRGQHVIVEIEYETSPSATALQWLTPTQTAGKKHPYLFSQCQATHCRTMIPCQDSPSVKHTYYAQVSIPRELVALMSALHDGQEPDPSDSSRVIYRFRQPVPMPSYLIAIVVGALESSSISAVPKAPPAGRAVSVQTSAGDRSLAGVIAHEISHSWTGNLVTNRTWEHFWLNEGHTVYIERMIARSMESEQLRQFKGIGGWKELQESVKQFGANNVLTNLVPNLHEVDTDEAFSSVPYEKGFALLYHLEELLGGPEVFMGFVKSYIQLFAYGSVTTEEWKNYLFTYFKDKVRTNALSEVVLKCFCLFPLHTALYQEPLPLSHVKKMQEVYQLNGVKNAEVRFRWLRICVKAHWEEAVPLALKMATEQGRMKFTRPLFKEVYNFSKYSDEAVKTFKENRGALHPVTAMLVVKDLKING